MPFESAELRKFTDAGRAISQQAGITLEQWAEGETAQILKAWAGLIHAQTPARAEVRGRNRVLNELGLTKGGVTINSGLFGPEGRLWLRAKNKRYMFAGAVGHNAGGFTPNPDRHFSNTQWAAGQAAVREYQGKAGIIELAKRTVGLARQSVVQIGDSIGIAIERIAGGGLSAQEVQQARSAVASNGQTYQNGFGVRQKNGTSFSIDLVNSYPKLTEAKVDLALYTAIGQRLGMNLKLLRDKLSASDAKVARAFPYLQVRG